MGDTGLVADAALSPSWIYYVAAYRLVTNLSVRDRRHAFQVMRNGTSVTDEHLMPAIGLTCGEFCVLHTLATQVQSRHGPAGAVVASDAGGNSKKMAVTE